MGRRRVHAWMWRRVVSKSPKAKAPLEHVAADPLARVAGNPQEHLATDRVEQEQRGQPALLVGVCPHAVCAGPNVRQVGETVSVFTAASLGDLIRRHTEWRMGTGPSPCASCCTCRGRPCQGWLVTANVCHLATAAVRAVLGQGKNCDVQKYRLPQVSPCSCHGELQAA